MLVADSSCLIFLAKINRLSLLEELYEKVIIPESVREEIIGEKIEERSIDVQRLEKTIEEKLIEVKELSKDQKKRAEYLSHSMRIGKGESEAIILAKSIETDLAVDDLIATRVARAQGLNTVWTTTIVRKAVLKEIISKGEAREIIEKLVSTGYWIAQDVLLEILHELES